MIHVLMLLKQLDVKSRSRVGYEERKLISLNLLIPNGKILVMVGTMNNKNCHSEWSVAKRRISREHSTQLPGDPSEKAEAYSSRMTILGKRYNLIVILMSEAKKNLPGTTDCQSGRSFVVQNTGFLRMTI